ncbi:MAG: hypothetical protein ACTSV2_06720 [Candidatus Thorarchaeota archaeon]
MSKSKWIMKQYWRVGSIRQIFGVLIGMFVLGRVYYSYVPGFNNLEPSIMGAIFLACFLLVIFIGVGYLYDVKLKLWNQKTQVAVEKNPYSYVPYIRYEMAEYPFFHAFIHSLRNIGKKKNLDMSQLEDLNRYLLWYFSLSTSRRSDLFSAEKHAEEFLKYHPFVNSQDISSHKIKWGERLKKGFQLRMWRLTWVQGLTGLAQDVLVFAVLYIGIIFPEVLNSSGEVSFDGMLLGIVLISLPLYITLIIAGYYYDKKLRLWAPDFVVKTERTPFSYVPEPKMRGFYYPFLLAIYDFFTNLSNKLNLDSGALESIMKYFEEFWELSPSNSGMARARKMRNELGSLFKEKKI